MAERTLSSTQRSLRSLPTAAWSPRSPPSSCQSPRRFDLQFPQTCQIGFRTLGNDYFIKNDLILFSVLTLYLTESCCALFPMVTYNPAQRQHHTHTFITILKLEQQARRGLDRMIKILFYHQTSLPVDRSYVDTAQRCADQKLECDPTSCYGW